MKDGLVNLHSRWSESEDDFIRVNYGEVPVIELAEKLGRTAGSVTARAKKVGVRPQRATHWSEMHQEKHPNGYMWIRRRGKVHRLVAAEQAGRDLAPTEVVHHIDCDRTNNDPENLLVCSGKEHAEFHRQILRLMPTLLEQGIVRFDDGYVLGDLKSREPASSDFGGGGKERPQGKSDGGRTLPARCADAPAV